ncbi:hypothetical protein M3O96_08655 [Aquiflexum sp. TKW24L]|uniref:hypothetical protein n=1 Tax=Aquiflexum sp. TKW24L TaxID=2942212 RepID=UPI0020BFF12A|nr:hypothetical protein [Aquiflexum sp. TKW24L]MCL6259155.1 hypothetical protein [Aquiflexum sp. TKW24L]
MGGQLLDVFKVFASGIFFISIFTFSIGDVQSFESLANPSTEAVYENLTRNNCPSSVDWQDIMVTGSNTTSIFSHDNSNKHFGSICWFFVNRSIHLPHSLFGFRSIKGLRFTGLLDQMHPIFFFF